MSSVHYTSPTAAMQLGLRQLERASAALWSLFQGLKAYRRKRGHLKLLPESGVLHGSPSEILIKRSPETNKMISVCAIAHVYYCDLANEIFSAFLKCGNLDSVLITTPTPFDPRLEAEVRKFQLIKPKVSIEIIQVKNQGRDILPFLLCANHPLAQRCSIFLKIHTKKSPHLAAGKGDKWRASLLERLCQDPLTIEQTIYGLSSLDHSWLACPNEYLFGKESWGKNKKRARLLANELGVSNSTDLRFPAGSMFWGKQEFLERIKPLIDHFQMEEDEQALDGTDAHAVERVFGLIALDEGRTIWAF